MFYVYFSIFTQFIISRTHFGMMTRNAYHAKIKGQTTALHVLHGCKNDWPTHFFLHVCVWGMQLKKTLKKLAWSLLWSLWRSDKCVSVYQHDSYATFTLFFLSLSRNEITLSLAISFLQNKDLYQTGWNLVMSITDLSSLPAMVSSAVNNQHTHGMSLVVALV